MRKLITYIGNGKAKRFIPVKKRGRKLVLFLFFLFLSGQAFASGRIVTGQYTGNGVVDGDTQSITGLGFTPVFVEVRLQATPQVDTETTITSRVVAISSLITEQQRLQSQLQTMQARLDIINAQLQGASDAGVATAVTALQAQRTPPVQVPPTEEPVQG